MSQITEVKWFTSEKGYGFIRDDGPNLWPEGPIKRCPCCGKPVG